MLTPDPRVEGSSISHVQVDAVIACLWGRAAHTSSSSLFSPTRRYNLFVRDVLGPRCVLLSQGTFSPSEFVMLLVSGTFFFPTSEINEISISHLTRSDFAFFSPPNK